MLLKLSYNSFCCAFSDHIVCIFDVHLPNAFFSVPSFLVSDIFLSLDKKEDTKYIVYGNMKSMGMSLIFKQNNCFLIGISAITSPTITLSQS